MKWMTKLSLSICISIFSFVGSIIISPLTERYQGATGYIYQNGLFYSLIQVAFVLIAIFALCYFIVNVRLDMVR